MPTHSEAALIARYILSRFRPLKRTFTCILLPIFLSPIPVFINTPEASCAYVVLIMGYFWVTETLPLAVTSLIPTFAYPLLCIETADAVSKSYLTDSNFVFFGSMIMAVAVESSRLHERIALRTLLLTGTNPRWLILGFQLATSFLSMWMSNTATTMMMVPIVIAVIKELDLCQRRESDPEARYTNDNEEILDLKSVPKDQLNVYKALLLSICFSSTIGGTATLIGTGSNIVLSSYLSKHYTHDNPVTFASFMFYALPQAIVLLAICWLWLQFLFIGFRKKHDVTHDGVIRRMLQKKLQIMGLLRYEEKTILATFGLLIFLWLSRKPVIIAGWGDAFPQGYVTDGTTAMFVSLLLFILPAENPMSPEVTEDLRPGEQIPTIMTWKLMRDKFSWSTLFLLGGGYAMASGVSSSGLSTWIGLQLTGLQQLPEWVFGAVACALVTILTEFTSNIATASIFIPMVAEIAKTHGINPLTYILPVTFSSSFAFMFPAGTPPNAIVFAIKVLRVSDMILGGLALNISGYVLCQILSHTYAHVIFDLDGSNGMVNTTDVVITH